MLVPVSVGPSSVILFCLFLLGPLHPDGDLMLAGTLSHPPRASVSPSTEPPAPPETTGHLSQGTPCYLSWASMDMRTGEILSSVLLGPPIGTPKATEEGRWGLCVQVIPPGSV